MIKKLFFILLTVFLSSAFHDVSKANLQEELANKLIGTKTLSFDFVQNIADEDEVGNCVIKFPLLMKCKYEDLKEKTIVSNGKTVAIIKKKYKKIYFYKLKKTPLFIILSKEKILNLIKNSKPNFINSNILEYKFTGGKSNELKIFFDKKSLELKGWETIDAYSNKVIFSIINLETNIEITNDFSKIPKEKDL